MPSWIKIEVNEETVSVLLIRWIEGGVHLTIMSQTYSYSDLFIGSSYFVRQFPAIFRNWCFPRSSQGSSQFYFFVFILDRISSLRSCCEIMEQRDTSESTPTTQRGFLFSEPALLNFWYNQRDYHPTRTCGFAFVLSRSLGTC